MSKFVKKRTKSKEEVKADDEENNIPPIDDINAQSGE